MDFSLEKLALAISAASLLIAVCSFFLSAKAQKISNSLNKKHLLELQKSAVQVRVDKASYTKQRLTFKNTGKVVLKDFTVVIEKEFEVIAFEYIPIERKTLEPEEFEIIEYTTDSDSISHAKIQMYWINAETLEKEEKTKIIKLY